jgi:PST family polysaccharide transporter
MSAPTEPSPNTPQPNPFKQLLLSSFIVGGASAISMLMGLIRIKAAAVLLGPTGVGLAGLLTAIMTTTATIAQAGTQTSGTQHVSAARSSGDTRRLAISRRALASITALTGIAGGLIVFFLSPWIALYAIGDANAETDVRWLSIGVALSVMATAQTSIIRGMLQVRQLAYVTIISAAMGTAIGVPVIWFFGIEGIIAYVLIAPAASFAFGWFFVSKTAPPSAIHTSLADLRPEWGVVLRQGIAFMTVALVLAVSHFLLRVDVRMQLGMDGLGLFQSSWTITTQYFAFVLGAVTADYFPRLTGIIQKPADARALVNNQTEILLVLSGILILSIIAFAPYIIALLYTSEFSSAGDLLRLQMLGYVFRMLAFPLGYLLVANHQRMSFTIYECVNAVTMIVAAHFFMKAWGLNGAGWAYVLSNAISLPIVFAMIVRRFPFSWSPAVVIMAALLSVLAAAQILIAFLNPQWTLVAGVAAIAVYAAASYRSLQRNGIVSGAINAVKRVVHRKK